MATLLEVWDSMRAQLIAALPVVPGIDWNTSCVFIDLADIAQIQNIARGGAIISIFDLTISRNTSRYMIYQCNQVMQSTGVASSVDNQVLSPGDTCTITIAAAAGNLTGAPYLNDGVSAIFAQEIQSYGDVGIAAAGMSFADMAAALAAAINADPNVNANLIATATSAQVAIRNISTHSSYKLSSWVGNVGSVQEDLAKTTRAVQITLWTYSHALRDMLGPAIMNCIGYWQKNGITFADNTWARLLYNSDQPGRDDHFRDICRWTFLVDVEFDITPALPLYGVLIPGRTKGVGPV